MRSQLCVKHHIRCGADTHILEYWVGHILDVVEDSSLAHFRQLLVLQHEVLFANRCVSFMHEL